MIDPISLAIGKKALRVAGTPQTRNKHLLFIAPVMATDVSGSSLAGNTANFLGLVDAARRFGIPSTWPVRYDAIDSSDYHPTLAKLLAEGHELGAWMEPMPGHCTAAGVTFSTAGSTAISAARVTYLGYTPAERETLVDTYMAAFLARFGEYPRSIHGWMIDAHTAAYCQTAYGIRTVSICKEQISTDAYELTGGPEGGVYEAAPDWLMVPARTGRRSGLAVIRNITQDLVRGYGSSSTVYTLEPVSVQQRSKTASDYFRPMLDELQANHDSWSVVSVLQENRWVWATYRATTWACMREMALSAAEGDWSLSLASEVGDAFLALPEAERDRVQIFRQGDVFGAATTEALQVTTPAYRARLRWRPDSGSSNGYFGITDLRCYWGDLADPYLTDKLTEQAGVWDVPYVMNAAQYDLSTRSAATQNDDPANGQVNLSLVHWNGSVATTDFAMPTPSAPIVVPIAPTAAGRQILYDRANGGVGVVEPRPRALVFSAAIPAAAATSNGTLHVEYGNADLALPNKQYAKVVGEAEVEFVDDGVASGNTTYTNVEYAAIVLDNLDAALIFWPMGATNGVFYFRAFRLNKPQFGLDLSSGATDTSMTFAIVPCAKSEWRNVLSELQAGGVLDRVQNRVLG